MKKQIYYLAQCVNLTVMLALFAPTCSLMPAYATVSTTAPRNDYLGNGSTDTYSYTFRIFAATDLRVTVRDTDNVETTLTYPTDYTVTGVNGSSGGTITLTAGNLTSGYALTIRFDRTPRQSTDLRNQGAFYPEIHEDKFDELTRYAQQLTDVVERSIHLPETEDGSAAATTLPVAAERASQYLAFDADGNPIAAAAVGTATVSAFMQTVLDDSTASAARATLDVPSNAEAVLDTLIDAKGDLIAGSAADTPTRVAVGSNGQVLLADSTAGGGVAWGTLYTFTTGDVKLTLKTSADTGWVLMNDGTIGSASSSATTRANADTESLYTLIWTNITDQWAPVTGGRGASAAADFAANKPLMLPKTLGRALAGYGTGTVTEAGVDGGVDTGGDTFTVAANNTKWITGMPIVLTLSSGTITGLTSGNTYYIIRSSSTLVQLASSLANAQNGTAVNMTAKSTPVWTLTHTYTTRVLGERAGEEAHAMSDTELLAHTHTAANGSATQGGGAAPGGATTTSGSRGGNAAMNIMQPTVFLNVMVKL